MYGERGLEFVKGVKAVKEVSYAREVLGLRGTTGMTLEEALKEVDEAFGIGKEHETKFDLVEKLRTEFPRELYPPIYIALEKGWSPNISELWEKYKEYVKKYIADSVNDPVKIAEMKEVTDPEEMWEYIEEQDEFFRSQAQRFLKRLDKQEV